MTKTSLLLRVIHRIIRKYNNTASSDIGRTRSLPAHGRKGINARRSVSGKPAGQNTHQRQRH
jgi:hypothetical protein